MEKKINREKKKKELQQMYKMTAAWRFPRA